MGHVACLVLGSCAAAPNPPRPISGGPGGDLPAPASPAPQVAQVPGVAEPRLSPEQIRRRREFRSRRTFWDVLAFPRYLLELPWYPVGRIIDWAEDIDLPQRLDDLFYLNQERTAAWFPNLSFGGLFGGGLGASAHDHDLFGSGHRVDASVLFGGFGYRLDGSYATPRDRRVAFELSLGYLDYDNVDVFVRADSAGNPVLGMDTAESDRGSYDLQLFKGQVTVPVQLSSSLQLRPYVRGEVSEATSGNSLLSRLDGMNEQIGLLSGGFELRSDRRDDAARPSDGWFLESRLEAGISPFETDQDQRYGHTTYALDARRYIPLPGPHRTLVLSQYLIRVDELGDNEVPFYNLPVLDINNRLRAYRRFRFRDRGALVTNLEYRYPVWPTMEAFVFLDGGQTFHEYSDIDLGEFEYAVGTGLRMLADSKLDFWLLVGIGSEGPQFRIRLRPAF